MAIKKRCDEQGMLFGGKGNGASCDGTLANNRRAAGPEGPREIAGGVSWDRIGRGQGLNFARETVSPPKAGKPAGWISGPCRIGETPAYIGTSGYSFRDWVGPFYPTELHRDEQLPFYAERFPAVEINSTYYHIPRSDTMERMLRRTPERFKFAIKCYKGITHEAGGDDALEEFSETLLPVKDSGRLGAVLAQFPQRFKNSPTSRDRLKAIAGRLSGFPVVVEFRDRSWAVPSALELLRSLGLGFCCVDEPNLPELFPRTAAATSAVGYLRFHGRNADSWYAGGAKRYDYDYSDAELEEWANKLVSIAPKVSVFYIFFNNCTAAHAAFDARRMAELIGFRGA